MNGATWLDCGAGNKAKHVSAEGGRSRLHLGWATESVTSSVSYMQEGSTQPHWSLLSP